MDGVIDVTPSVDWEEIDRILTGDSIWPFIKDDSVVKEGFSVKPMIDRGLANFLIVKINGRPDGVMTFIKGDEPELHTSLGLGTRGHIALQVAKEAFDWAFAHFGCDRIVTYILSNEESKPAKLMARIVGFKEFKREPHPNKVNGETVERIWYALTKPAWEKSQINS